MKKTVSDLAVCGGTPEFFAPLHVGQRNLPPWDDFTAAFRGIFRRQYFTNHGPLVQELDRRVARYLGVRQAVCVTNGTMALMVACRALGLRGRVVVPAMTFPATVQALTWAGLVPVFADVDPESQCLTPETVLAALTPDVAAVLGVHLWGRACDPAGLEILCRHKGIPLFFDAAHGFGSRFGDRYIGNFGACEAFSFHFATVMSTAEGGAVVTNDDALAAKIRTVRNFHVAETFSSVDLRINGKMSEAQAAIGLLGLDCLDGWIAGNKEQYNLYRELSQDIPGWFFVDHAAGQASNYQYCTALVDETAFGISRDALVDVLRAENCFPDTCPAPGMHRVPPYSASLSHRPLPVTDRLCRSLIQLPLGAAIDKDNIRNIMGIIRFCAECAPDIRQRLPGRQG